MPLRTITPDDGTERTRNITNIHQNGEEFLPEEFALSGDTDEGVRIYRALERLIYPPESEL